MATNSISGKLINFKYRLPGETDWLTIVCTEDSSFTITSEITTRPTNCGIVGQPGIPNFSASGGAVQNVQPTEFEANYQAIKELIKAGTKVEFSYISEADAAQGFAEGDAINNSGVGYFGELGAAASADDGEVLTFSWSFTGVGVLDEFDES